MGPFGASPPRSVRWRAFSPAIEDITAISSERPGHGSDVQPNGRIRSKRNLDGVVWTERSGGLQRLRELPGNLFATEDRLVVQRLLAIHGWRAHLHRPRLSESRTEHFQPPGR